MSKNVDLDDLLDKIDINSLEPKKTTNDLDDILNDAANTVLAKPKEADIDKELKIRIVSDDIRPWLAASANVPKEYREKWTKMTKIDVETELVSRFQPSIAYRNLEPTSTKVGIGKCLQDLVKKSASKSGIDETKAAKILSAVNPITDVERGSQLQRAYTKQVIHDLKGEIQRDPNYDSKKFSSLAAVIAADN